MANTALTGSRKVGVCKSMGYNKQNRKTWSINAHAAKARKSLCEGSALPILEDDEITININRKRTGENINLTLLPGSRCDNYRVYVDGKSFKNTRSKSGCWGINLLCRKIAKSLPRFMSEANYE